MRKNGDAYEECYDEIRTFGRNHAVEINKAVAKNEFEVPFRIWCSNEYKMKNPNIISAIKSSTNLPFYISDMGHMILFLAGIKSNVYKPEYNILDTKYDHNRKRLLKGSISYEEIY